MRPSSSRERCVHLHDLDEALEAESLEEPLADLLAAQTGLVDVGAAKVMRLTPPMDFEGPPRRRAEWAIHLTQANHNDVGHLRVGLSARVPPSRASHTAAGRTIRLAPGSAPPRPST
jgi:hypothetical protein